MRVDRRVRIPVRDGTLLAATLFFPDDEASGPWPALLEYQPYRKDDNVAGGGAIHAWFAERGFVGVMLDVRGTGGSGGRTDDEYTLTEQLDGCDAIAWLAAQPWCNGRVGMFGTSYGGFNSIQIAMHRPPALRAIAPHAATDDRFGEDVHFIGGCLAGMDVLVYGLGMVAQNALPPHADLAGPARASIWQEHLDSEPWLLEWLRHQLDDDYWANGSLKHDYGSIEAAVLHLGGWNDGYVNAVFRMLEHLSAPNEAIVGPWTHQRPHQSYTGPAGDHLGEMAQFFGQWLRDDPAGNVVPHLRYFAQRSYPPDRFPRRVPGEWRSLPTWPAIDAEERIWALGAGTTSFEYDPTVGTAAGFWCPSGAPFGGHADQRVDDARSVTFDLDDRPLALPLRLLGVPRVRLGFSSTAPVAMVCAKLCDVAPDGASTLITRGWLNATRRGGMATAEALVSGEVYDLEVPLRVTSWELPAGHTLRLSVSSADFPTVWPTPYAATNTLHLDRCSVVLPLEPLSAVSCGALGPPPSPRATARVSAVGVPRWDVVTDELRRETTVALGWGSRTEVRDRPIVFTSTATFEAKASKFHPARASVSGRQTLVLDDAGSITEVRAAAAIHSTEDALHVDVELEVDRAGIPFLRRSWSESIPRLLL